VAVRRTAGLAGIHHFVADFPPKEVVPVHLESGEDVVILEGVAEVVTDPGLVERLFASSKAKYGMGSRDVEGSYVVRPRVVSRVPKHLYPMEGPSATGDSTEATRCATPRPERRRSGDRTSRPAY
jgi:hypothetical protein